MVGGQQVGPNPETRGWIAPQQQQQQQQQGGDPFTQAGAVAAAVASYGHKRGPFQQGFGVGDPSKLAMATNATQLDINYRDHYPAMEPQPEGGSVVVFKAPEWGQDGGGGRDLSVSDGSLSEGSEDEDEDEEEEEEEEEEDEDDDLVENDDEEEDDKDGPDTVANPQVVEGVSGLPPSLDQIRPEHAFQRNNLTVKAATAGTSNSPFGIFQTPSSALPFLNSMVATPHNDGLASQNGGGGGGGMAAMASASGAAASYSLTRDGGLSRDVVTREATVVTTTMMTTTTTSSALQEPSARGLSSGLLHEQLQSTDVDNYYTTLLNTQTTPPNNNGLPKGMDAASRRMADPQSVAESSLRRILSDPLTGALMDDAMIISCGHSVGNAGRRRVMETSVCIICGASVRTEAMAPNYALRMVVQAFKREEEMNGNLSLRSTKRRRDTVQESVGLSEHAAAADAAKVKGVQFPFVVSDRVMIKGNKRTPERFVGREAVITTQCLNGWYLVRTLDTGESVRLQYRSLQKMGGNGPAIAEFANVNSGAVSVQ